MSIRFEPLKLEEIQTLRLWRMDPHNAEWFEFEKEISENDQLLWFNNLEVNKQLFFSYYQKDQLFGFFHLKNIDLVSRTAECGIITNPDQSSKIGITLPGSLELIKIAFKHLDLASLYAKVKANNRQIIHYNNKLGFKLDQKCQNQAFQWMKLTKENFDKIQAKLELLCKHID